MPKQAIVREMGLRDGLQSVATVVPIHAKVEWIRDAYAAGEREIEVGSQLSASHAHSLANLRKTPDEVLAEIAGIIRERDAAGSKTRIEIGISTAFGCTIQGRVDPNEVCGSSRPWSTSASVRWGWRMARGPAEDDEKGDCECLKPGRRNH